MARPGPSPGFHLGGGATSTILSHVIFSVQNFSSEVAIVPFATPCRRAWTRPFISNK